MHIVCSCGTRINPTGTGDFWYTETYAFERAMDDLIKLVLNRGVFPPADDEFWTDLSFDSFEDQLGYTINEILMTSMARMIHCPKCHRMWLEKSPWGNFYRDYLPGMQE